MYNTVQCANPEIFAYALGNHFDILTYLDFLLILQTFKM